MTDVKAAVATAAGTKAATFALAVLIGLGLGGIASPSPVTLPAVGTTSSLYPGVAAILVGGGALLARDRLVDSGCGCDGDCGC